LLWHADVKLFACFVLLCLPSYGIAMNNVKSQPLERAMEYIGATNPSEALKILSGYQPSSEDISLYHYAYAKAYELSEKQYESIAHFRMAYLYSKDDEMKERSLLERAEVYAKIGFHSEATLTFRIFLKKFPHSSYEMRAFLGLADSLYRLGLFTEAEEAYEKAGNSTRASYGRANALHSMGKIKDAHEIYLAMIEKDRGYVESSQETLYNVGENFRLMGENSAARIYFNSSTASPFKYRAFRSLGLIEFEEGHFDTAKKFFSSALQSPEKQVRRQALLNLADTYIKQGRQEDAKSVLSEIRRKYPYGKEYEEALLLLSQLYKKEGNFKEPTSLLKELVFRYPPNQKALDEFEILILEAEEKGEEEFLKLWRCIGHWLLQPSRSQSLLKIVKGLKHTGKPYLETCTWLSQYGSDDVKSESILLLAGFYADLGDSARAMKYLQMKGLTSKNDDVLRITAKIHRANAEYQKAASSLLNIKELNQDDLIFFADLLESVQNDHKIMEFFKRALSKLSAPPGAYLKLADILYKRGGKAEALQYYQAVVSLHQKGLEIKTQDLQWALYRISELSVGEDAKNTLETIRKNNDTDAVHRFSVLLLQELNITERVNGIF
jgi:tetratricopeptide (TPR) repeat protein